MSLIESGRPSKRSRSVPEQEVCIPTFRGCDVFLREGMSSITAYEKTSFGYSESSTDRETQDDYSSICFW